MPPLLFPFRFSGPKGAFPLPLPFQWGKFPLPPFIPFPCHMLPISIGVWPVSLRLSNPVTCLDRWYSVITFLAVSYVSSNRKFIPKCCRSVPVVLLSSVVTSMLSGSAVSACVSYFVFRVSHSLSSCSNCSVPNLNSSILSSKLTSGAVPGSENSVSKRHVSNPFSSTFDRTTS